MYTTNCFYRYIENTSERLDQHFLNPVWDDKILKMKYNNFVPFKMFLKSEMDTGIAAKKEQTFAREVAQVDSINYIQIGSMDWKGNITDETDYKIDLQILESLDESQIVKKNDLLFAATGATIGKVGFYEFDEPSIACGDIIIAKVNDERFAEFLHFFMLTDYGKEQILKHIFGSTNGHIKIADVGNILVPRLTEEILELFNETVVPLKNAYFDVKEQAKNLLVEIERLLLNELGWENAFKKLPAAEFTHKFFRYPSQITSRLDTLYNDIVFDKLFENIEISSYNFFELSKYVDLRLELRNPQNEPEEFFDYVDIGNIDTAYGQPYAIRMQGFEATSSRVRQVMYANDILVSTTRPTRRAIAMVPDALNNQICSTGFAVLTPKEGVSGEFLFHILRSEIVTAQFERLCSGSGYPAINKENDVLRILIPEVDSDKQEVVLSKIRPKLERAKLLEIEAENKWSEAKQRLEDIMIIN